MQALAARYITEEEYWELEANSETKHEYFNGYVYAMASGSNRHAVISANANIALGSRLRGKPCRSVVADQRVKVEATGLQTYPDVAVYYPPARFEGKNDEVLLNPTVLIEVLSPSTAAYDKGDKFDHYKQIESLCDYILIEQKKMQVEHYHRLENGDWLLRTLSTPEARVTLESVDCVLPLDELYDGVQFPTEPQPLRALTPPEE